MSIIAPRNSNLAPTAAAPEIGSAQQGLAVAGIYQQASTKPGTGAGLAKTNSGDEPRSFDVNVSLAKSCIALGRKNSQEALTPAARQPESRSSPPRAPTPDPLRSYTAILVYRQGGSLNRWRENAVHLLTLSMSAALVVTGYLLGLIVTRAFLYAALLVLVVALMSSGISVWVANRSSISLAAVFDAKTQQAVEKLTDKFQSSFNALDATVGDTLKSVERTIYDYLVTFNPMRNIPQPGGSEITVLTKEQAAAIEASAHEMWVYAVNMNWDIDESGFGKVLEDNLRESARYRFLIPDRPEVKNRARVLYARWRRIPNIEAKVSFRVRSEELLFAKFGITIYNPTYEKSTDERAGSPPCVILFPNFNRSGPTSNDPYIKVTGSVVSDYEVEFSQVWQLSTKYTPEVLESE